MNFETPQNFKIKFAVISYNMKLKNFLHLQTYKQK